MHTTIFWFWRRAILLSCFIYDTPPFKPPMGSYSAVAEALQNASGRGMQRWQVNFHINELGVRLDRLARF